MSLDLELRSDLASNRSFDLTVSMRLDLELQDIYSLFPKGDMSAVRTIARPHAT